MSIEVKKLRNVNDGEMYNIWTVDGKPNPMSLPDGFINVDGYLRATILPIRPPGIPELKPGIEVYTFDGDDGSSDFNGDGLNPPDTDYVWKVLIGEDTQPNMPQTSMPQTSMPQTSMPLPQISGKPLYYLTKNNNPVQVCPDDADFCKNWQPVSMSPDPEDEDGLTGGQIAGIVLLALGGLGLLIFIIMLIVNSTKKKKKVSFNFMSFQEFIRN